MASFTVKNSRFGGMFDASKKKIAATMAKAMRLPLPAASIAAQPVLTLPGTFQAPVSTRTVPSVPSLVQAPAEQSSSTASSPQPVAETPTSVLTEVVRPATASLFSGKLPFIMISGVVLFAAYKLFFEKKARGKR